MPCFVHFDFKMCFSLQPRAIFPHRNFKKCSETLNFLAFWLPNVFLATAACNFLTSELQKVVRSWRVLYILTSKCASRHSGVQFFISPLTTWLRTRRFSEPTFRGTRHTNHWKNTAFRDFSNIWRGCILFLLTFALLDLLSSDSISSHLLFICFSTLHIVGSLLFKLPSTTYTRNIYTYWVFPLYSKPSILGYPYFWKHPYSYSSGTFFWSTKLKKCESVPRWLWDCLGSPGQKVSCDEWHHNEVRIYQWYILSVYDGIIFFVEQSHSLQKSNVTYETRYPRYIKLILKNTATSV